MHDNVNSIQKARKKSTVSNGFVWAHATAANGGAMAISATISTYFSLYCQEDIGITAAQLSIVMLIGSLWDVFTTPIMGVVCDFLNPRWGRYLNGIIASVRGFAQKAGNTVVNAGMLAILAAAGFDATLGPFGQSESALAATNSVRFLVPSAVSILIVIIMVFYPLRKYFPEIAAMKERMAEERASEDAANNQ